MSKRARVPFFTRAAAIRVAILLLILGALLMAAYVVMIAMPGRTYSGELDPLTEEESVTLIRLKAHVTMLAAEIGERHLERPEGLARAATYIKSQFQESGYAVATQPYEVDGKPCHNIEVELRGSTQPDDILVIGGHYDSVSNCPGANDNATGTAAVLELARAFSGKPLARTVRFVAFVNEEPPYFQTDSMGSLVYARRCSERNEKVVGMLSLETLGCYSDAKGSQSYPPPFSLVYPSTGDFVCFIGNVGSRSLIHETVRAFRESTRFPSEGGAIPGFVPGVGWSDHWSFWQEGYSALMVTDTAPFRYAHYHSWLDKADQVDYERLTRVVVGLKKVIIALADFHGK